MSLLYVQKVYRSNGFHSKIFSYQHLFSQLFVFPTFKLLVCVQICRQERSHWGEPWGHAPPPRPTSISEPNKVNSFSFKHQGYYFLRAFRNYMDRKFHDFYRVFNNFWTIYDEFSFFLHKENASLHVGPRPTETSLK